MNKHSYNVYRIDPCFEQKYLFRESMNKPNHLIIYKNEFIVYNSRLDDFL